MGFGRVYSAQIVGSQAVIVQVDVDISKGLNAVTLVGMGDKSVQESIDRISSALSQLGFRSPRSLGARVVISLSPSSIRKTGTGFDLPILLSYLIASNLLRPKINLSQTMVIGEVALDGKLLPTTGVLPKMMLARKLGFNKIIIPFENTHEASCIPELSLYPAQSVQEVIDHLNKKKAIPFFERGDSKNDSETTFDVALEDIKGNPLGCRILEIAATGRHNLLLFGEPGGGKTLLASAIPSILPPLTYEQSLEVTSLYSIAGSVSETLITYPPFRSPHHTSSYPSIIGGGTLLRPGEVSLAHYGVLFLDEFPLFGKRVMNTLREPLESQKVTLARSSGNATFPADFMLIAALNPSDSKLPLQKIPPALFDRFDISLNIPKVSYETIRSASSTTTSSEVLQRVAQARDFAYESRPLLPCFSARIRSQDIEEQGNISPEALDILCDVSNNLKLSVRGVIKTLRVARSIADLEQTYFVKKHHIYEALSLRVTRSP